MTEVSPPRPESTLVFLFGASSWPECPEFADSPALPFQKSAEALRNYFTSVDGFGLPEKNLLDLFDAQDPSLELMGQFRRFVQVREAELESTGDFVHDLLVYYIGHGGFADRGREYCLAVRATKAWQFSLSSVPVNSLADALNSVARHCRRYLLFDCCFAASAFKTFQGAPAELANQRTDEAFSKGTALLCSSGPKDVSMAPEGEEHTMFTGALLDCLDAPHDQHGNHLSLKELADLVKLRIYDKFEEKAVRPEVHSPAQPTGEIETLPFFPNQYAKAWSDLTPTQKIGKLSILLGCKERGAVDDLETAIVNFVSGAKKRLEIAVPILNSQAITRAIAEVRLRKILVKLVVSRLSIQEPSARRDPWVPGGRNEPGRDAFYKFMRANIDCTLRDEDRLGTNRFIIRDRKDVLLASSDFTRKSLHKNLSYLFMVEGERNFANLWAKEFWNLNRSGDSLEVYDPPKPNKVSGLPLTVYFGTVHFPESQMVTELLRARHQVDFMVSQLQSLPVKLALESLVRSRVRLRGIVDSDSAGDYWAEILDWGAEIYTLRRTKARTPRLQSNLIVIDGEVLLGRGFHELDASFSLNQEHIWVLGRDATGEDKRTGMRAFGKSVAIEIDRIIKEFGNPMRP